MSGGVEFLSPAQCTYEVKNCKCKTCFRFQGPPSLRQFDADEFLKSLDHSGPQLTSGVKGDWEGLYKRFFRSNNFEGWYYNRQYEVNQKIQVLHMEALCQAVSFLRQVFNVKWNILF